MKKIIFLISISFLLSCNSEKDIPEPQDDSYYWGYFEGEINGKNISLRNKKQEEPVVSIGYDFYAAGDSQDSIKGMWTSIHYSVEDESIHIDLYNPRVGIRYMTTSNKEWKKTGGIYISRFGKPNPGGYYLDSYYNYYPDPNKPFQVEILSTTYKNSQPIVEVKLDGVLYRSDNMNDSIIVKGTYGAKI